MSRLYIVLNYTCQCPYDDDNYEGYDDMMMVLPNCIRMQCSLKCTFQCSLGVFVTVSPLLVVVWSITALDILAAKESTSIKIISSNPVHGSRVLG